MPPGRIGTEFAQYRIEGIVGRGGTSVVYRAEYPRLRIPVALKVLSPEVADDESFRERFVRESRRAAGINHPNIIPIYDAGVWEDSLYIAMRYVAGGNLKTRTRDGPLDPGRALAILAQVASGLDAAHAGGLVHRDVKSANVMVDSGFESDGPEIAYLTDFGLIKEVGSGGYPTPTGQFLGTIAYVAPEQIEGRPVDARTDLYSLGCVAFECLTGRVPFERDNDAATLWAHMQEEAPSAATLNTELPPGVDRVLARAMAKSPDDRYATGRELVEALRSELEPGMREGPAVPRADASIPSPGRRSLSARLAVPAAAALLGAGAAAAAFVALDDEDGRRGAATVTIATTVVGADEGLRESPLAAAIPESVRATCEPTRAPTPDFGDTFLCRPGRGILVRYSHALSGPLLTEYFARRLTELGFPAPERGAPIRTVGACSSPTTFPAVGEWYHVGRAGHEAIGQSRFRNHDGRVLCYIARGKARIEWTTTFAGYYGYAEAESYSRLFRWWRSEAGPSRL
jgi:hypothetical protein